MSDEEEMLLVGTDSDLRGEGGGGSRGTQRQVWERGAEKDNKGRKLEKMRMVTTMRRLEENPQTLGQENISVKWLSRKT